MLIDHRPGKVESIDRRVEIPFSVPQITTAFPPKGNRPASPGEKIVKLQSQAAQRLASRTPSRR